MRWWWLVGALCALAVAAPVAAADEIGAPFSRSAAELRALADAAGEVDASVVVLWEAARFRYDEAGRRQFRLHRIYKVVDRSGVDGWDSLGVSWAPWHQNEPRMRARVLGPGGRIFELDPKTVSAQPPASSSAHTYSDWRSVRAPLPGVGPGAIVEEVVEIDDREPFFAAGSIESFRFGFYDAPAQRTRLVVDMPAGARLRHVVRRLPKLERRVLREGDRRLWIFESGALAPVKPESSLPADAAPVPVVSFTTGRSWRQVAAAYAELVDAQIAAGPPPAAAVPEPGKSRAETVARALALVHRHVRYTGLEFGQNAIVPWTPAETWSRGYGDCKDKATLLVAILRRLGIAADVVLLDSGSDYDVEPALPGLGSFDHAIVRVAGGPPIWIDATVELARPGQLPISAQGRRALVARRGVGRLSRVPADGFREHRLVEERRVELASYGPGRVVETSRYGGAQEIRWRYEFRGVDVEQGKKNLASYADSEYGAEIAAVKLGDTDDLSRPYELTLELKGYADTGTHSGSVFLGTWNISQLLPSELSGGLGEEAGEQAPRERPLALVPHTVLQRYRISAPPGFRPVKLPTTRHQVVGPLRIRREVRRAGDEVIIEAELALTARRATPEQVAAMRSVLARFAAEERPEVRFEHQAMALADRGQLAEAAALLHRLVAAHPGDAGQRARLAMVLRMAGLVAEARVEARRATSADPDSRLAQLALGEACEAGPLGRPYQRGLDRGCAMAAYRRALELAPDDYYARGSLALLLARDELGRWLEGDLAAAATELRRAIADAGNDGAAYELSLAAVLAAAGRWNELAELAPQIDDEDGREAARIAATAARRDVAAAMAVVRGLPRERREEAALTAVSFLLSARAWPAYVHLIRELRDQGIEVQVAASVLERLLKPPRLPAPVRAAADYMALLALGYELDDPRAKAVLARSAQQVLAAAPEHFWSDVAGMQTASNGVRPSSMAAFLRAAYAAKAQELAVAGDAVWLRLEVGGKATEAVLVREGGRWKWLADPLVPELLGPQALAFASAGKWAEARVLLDAARSHTGGVGPGKPFAMLWALGQRGSPEDIRAAAAVLAASGKGGKAALDALRRCAHGGGERGAWCAEAASQLLWGQGQLQKALAAHRQALCGGVPAGDEVDILALSAHLEAGRMAEAAPLLRQLEKTAEGRRVAALRRGFADAKAGRLDVARSLFAMAAEGATGSRGPLARNMVAWLELFGRKPDLDAALAQAREALADRPSSSVRNTMAAVHAARGEVGAAVEILRQQRDELGALGTSDWLVYGRIAAACGRVEAARRAYDRVIAGIDAAEQVPYDAAALARRWRAQLPER